MMSERKKVKLLSRVQLFVTPWIVAYQAPPSMEFSRQEYRSGSPFPSPGELPGMEPASPAFRADATPSEPPGKPTVVDTLFNMKSGTNENCVFYFYLNTKGTLWPT